MIRYFRKAILFLYSRSFHFPAQIMLNLVEIFENNLYIVRNETLMIINVFIYKCNYYFLGV
jgi:hypothetical protein